MAKQTKTKNSSAGSSARSKPQSLLKALVQDALSDEDFSDDDNVEIKGLSETAATSASGHTVNLSKQSAKTQRNIRGKRVSLYVGNLPKSFEQYELRKYFSQFGDVTRCRLLRNRKTGKSRLYGFVEFNYVATAEVAAETMDNYLLAGSNIVVKVLKNHKDNLYSSKMKSSFGEFNWRKKDHDAYNAPKSAEEWKRLQAEFEQRKKDDMAHLAAAGFDYAFEV